MAYEYPDTENFRIAYETMQKKILVIGTGGNSIDILDCLNEINEARGETIYECLGFLDDDKNKWGKRLFGIPVLGPLTEGEKYKDCFFISGIGSPTSFLNKRSIIDTLKISIEKFETIVHPTASVSKMAKLGYGSVVFQQVTVTSGVHIGSHVVILPSTVVSHDDDIGDYTCIAGGVCISGDVRVGESCYIGTNATIRNGLIIGNRCLIGMGSVVLHDVPDDSVVVGNPARLLRSTKKAN
jgi:sugar O-acyltransferase (sialic acid O-acetyltransferase NeuD family)